MNIPLGSVCSDKATGYTGTVCSKTEMLNGNVQYSVIPPAKKDSTDYPAGISLDGAQLEVVEAGVSEIAGKPNLVALQIGEKAKDIITGMSGIVFSKTTFLNGCVYFTMSIKDKDKDPAELFLPVERLERAGVGIIEKLKKAVKPTGGPATAVRHAC